MQIEFLVNGSVTLLLCPDNEMEEQLLKQMIKQENELTELRSTVIVLNKSFKNSLLIGKKSREYLKIDENIPASNDSEKETL